MVAGVVVGTLVLIFLNVVLFSLTGKNEFLWLGLAEIAFTLNSLHTEGYTGIFLFPNNPILSLAFGDIVKCTFAITMAQFARSFVQTRKNFPQTDIALRGLIYFGLAVIILQLGAPFYNDILRMVLFYTAWIVAVISALTLPFIGIFATRKLGSQYWPLILAWGSLGVYVLYAAIASSGIIKNLPINWHLAAPIGLFEAIMATFALTLHIRKIQTGKIKADLKLTESLKERLKISDQANRLTTENAMAIATIHDQNSLLHSSGHDSQQVLVALKSAVHFMSSQKKNEHVQQVSDILEASAHYLENIVSTTMSMPIASIDKQEFLALSGFSACEFFEPLNMIYGRVCREKGIQFKFKVDSKLSIISDRALLMRAVSNYLSNALKFTQSGTVEIDIKFVLNKIRISIRDTGVGIDDDMAADLNASLFGRRRGTFTFAGTGSGYLSSKKIIRSVGGSVKIKARKTVGTQVDIFLPHLASIMTACDTNDLENTLEGFELIDLESAGSKLLLETLELSPNDVVATYDDSTQTRHRLSEFCHIMLLKPLYREMIDHPAFKLI